MLIAGDSTGKMSWDERCTLVNRLRIAEMRLSEAEEVMKNAQKAFDENMVDLEQSVTDITK